MLRAFLRMTGNDVEGTGNDVAAPVSGGVVAGVSQLVNIRTYLPFKDAGSDCETHMTRIREQSVVTLVKGSTIPFQ